MAGRDRRELFSHLTVLTAHLLKCVVQTRVTNSWRATIREQRRQIDLLLKQSPSLRGTIEGELMDIFEDAVLKAVGETELRRDLFPTSLPSRSRRC